MKRIEITSREIYTSDGDLRRLLASKGIDVNREYFANYERGVHIITQPEVDYESGSTTL